MVIRRVNTTSRRVSDGIEVATTVLWYGLNPPLKARVWSETEEVHTGCFVFVFVLMGSVDCLCSLNSFRIGVVGEGS